MSICLVRNCPYSSWASGQKGR
uniref:Uncharacterized protein n=1 Tax=Anguilla anguilla TaxID=7936 RepID=A0A0E9SKX8_ANGAN